METKVLQVFYGKDGLPYKDKERSVHFPIVGTGFLGASNTTKIKFYYGELDETNQTSWVAVSKLPNGKIGSRVLESYTDEALNEHYALLELDSFYTQYKGEVFISLQGYQGGVQVDFDEETQLYTINGTPTIAATGSVKFTINYANQFVGSGQADNVTLQRILADLGTKLGIRARSEHVDELPIVGESDVFYVINNDLNDPNKQNIYIWNSISKHYVWVGDNTLDLGDYYTKSEGNQFEQGIEQRVSGVENELSSVASGSPKGVYATLSDLTTADPNHNYIYLVLEDNKWYYYNTSTSSWTAGGTYLSSSPDNNLNDSSINSVQNKAIYKALLEGNVEPTKLYARYFNLCGKTLTLNYANQTLTNGYIGSNGQPQEAGSHGWFSIPADFISKIQFTTGNSALGGFPIIFVKKADGTGNYYAYNDTNTQHTLVISNLDFFKGGTIYFNAFSKGIGDFVNSCTLTFVSKERAVSLASVENLLGAKGKGKITIAPESIDFYANAYITRGASIQSTDSHTLRRIPLNNIKKVSMVNPLHELTVQNGLSLFVAANSNGVIGVSSYDSDTGIETLEIGNQSSTKIGNAFLYFNDFLAGSIIGKAIDTQYNLQEQTIEIEYFENENQNVSNDIKAKDYIRKPFNFSGKKALFVGDSITWGYTKVNGEATRTSYPYPSTFSSRVGMTGVNNAVSGATIVDHTSGGYSYIYDQLVNTSDKSTFDFVFIAGGINDWQLNSPKADLKTEVAKLITYIKANFTNAEIIFITPIDCNENGWKESHPTAGQTMTIQECRNIITYTAIENDDTTIISVVQGGDFGFPTSEEDATFISAMYADSLHPSNLGYHTLYLSGLCKKLL